MDPFACDLLKADAARYIWWETSAEAMRRPARVIAQVMNIGDLDDVSALLDSVGEDSFREVLANAEPGWFNAKSWHYWHYALGLCRPSTLASPWKDLAEKLGGVGELAKSLGGVDPTTLRRWAQGRMPNRSARMLIVGLFKKHGIKAPEFGSPKQSVSGALSEESKA